MNDTATRMIEISQDGAGLVLIEDSYHGGFYTEDVQTCIVYCFRGSEGLCVIHDTGQIAIGDIVSLVRRIGRIESVAAAQRSAFRSRLQDVEHEKRRVDVFRRLGWKGGIQRVDAPEGWVAFPRSGESVTMDRSGMIIEKLPERTRRMEVNVLNNMFSAPNSQTVRVDLQYSGSRHTPLPILAFRTEDMEAKARRKSESGDPDYLSELATARRMGLLEGGE